MAAAVAATPATASAADPVLPDLPICVQTDILPAIGSCTPAPTTPEQPAATPDKGACADAGLVPDARNLARIRVATLCLLNKERTRRGRKKLRSQATLAGVARRYAGQMVRERFFDHVSPSGSTMLARIKRTSYLRGGLSRWSVGENLAWATGELATPAGTMRSWMASPGHRRNILDRSFNEIGVGVVTGTPGGDRDGATYVTEFGQRILR